MTAKRWVSCGMVAVLVVLLTTVVVAQQKAPETVTIKEFPNPTKGAVTFPHQKHSGENKLACNQCHHQYQDGKNIWKEGDKVDKCGKCHTEMTVEGEKKLPPDQQKLNLKLAFHNLCQGCHQKVKKENPGSKAALTCNACHASQKQ